MRPAARWSLLLGLTAATGLALVLLLGQLELDDRLDAFLPPPADDRQALVADQLTRGPGASAVIAAMRGAPPERLAALTREWAGTVTGLEGVERVTFAPPAPSDPALQRILDIYPLLVANPAEHITPEALRAALADRYTDLSLGGRAAEALVRRDPLGLLRDLAAEADRAAAPATRNGVWYDPAERRTLALVELAGGGFDIDAQATRVTALRRAFTDLSGRGDAELVLTGPPVFSADSASAARRDARWLSALASIWVIVLLALAWRRADRVIAGGLPLMAGLLAGLATVAVGFGAVHGLALAFGFTLLGVAVDYPVHLLAHHPGDPGAARRRVIRPLGLGALSTVIAYAAIWLSASPGLAQLGALSAAGLLAAALVTLFVLPYLVTPGPAPVFAGSSRIERLPRLPWLPPAAGLAAIALLATAGDRLWSDDLSRLSPIPAERLALDGELRQALGAGDVRHLIVVTGDSREAVLRDTEHLTGTLAAARAAGEIESWRAVTRLVPSQAAQRQRLDAWPSPVDMGRRLRDAARTTPFRAEAFGPFLDILAGLPDEIPITPDTWAGTPLAREAGSLLLPPGGEGQPWRSLVVPAGLDDPEAIAARLAGTAQLVDLKAVSEDMVRGYRREVLVSLGVALALIIALLAWRGRRGELLPALISPLSAVVVAAAIMAWLAGGLSIVHLMALILVAGIGLDYSLFLRHAGTDRTATLQSLLVCAATTGGVFAILGLSSIVLLAQLGGTLTLGIGLALVFALCARRDKETA